jgi:hypothetical protein
MPAISLRNIAFLFIPLLVLNSCRKNIAIPDYDYGRPRRATSDYFDKKYLLYKLPTDYYAEQKLNQSFSSNSANGDITSFKPLGFDPKLNLQYTHVYSDQCVYHTADTVWKYGEVCFPNTCITKDSAYAEIRLKNTSSKTKTYYLRLFYQNTSYWYRTDDSLDFQSNNYLDNYYGTSGIISATVEAGKEAVVKIPYRIGLNAKGDFNFDASKDPARPGNYEFLVVTSTVKDNLLFDDNLDLQKQNPFAIAKTDQLKNAGKTYFNQSAYVGPQHFKFVFLDEYFDKVNDLTPNHIYLPKDGKEKKLCDTCSGWFKGLINEYWKSSDFFTGFISKAYFVKADYGIKKELTVIDTNGVTCIMPKSTRGSYRKTWGEFLFGPSFKYGHLTVRAKFAQMMNKTGTPNGIIHNLWLYQRDPDAGDESNPYSYLRNPAGKQPYEIDFEIWDSEEGINTMWDDNAFINYSIVDYMRDPNVLVKPGEMKKYGKYTVNRLNKRQLNIPGGNIPRQYFDGYHTYELYWYPDHVRFLTDGYEQAVITKDIAKIPDKYLFLWIGSPFYQDGIYYNESWIPFLEKDKRTIVDYIKIE